METPFPFIYINKALQPLSLAVHPVDRSAQEPTPFGKMTVILKGSPKKPMLNASGYWVYVGVPPRAYEVEVKPDKSTDYYLSKSFSVTLPSNGLAPNAELNLDDEVTLIGLPGALLAEVRLIPNAAFPFPSNATLVRILVVQDDGGTLVPVPDAQVRVLEQGNPLADVTFRTGPKGQSVLFCNRITRDRIEEINGRAYAGTRDLRIEARHPDVGQGALDLTVEDFKTTSGTITLV